MNENEQGLPKIAPNRHLNFLTTVPSLSLKERDLFSGSLMKNSKPQTAASVIVDMVLFHSLGDLVIFFKKYLLSLVNFFQINYANFEDNWYVR